MIIIKSSKSLFFSSVILVFDRVFRIVGGTTVTILAARYFGPADFGVLAYAQSLMVLVTFMAALGLPEIALREMVRRADDLEMITLAALCLRITGGIVAVVIAYVISLIGQTGEQSTWIVVIVAFGLIFQAFDVFEWRLQAKQRQRLIVVIRLSSFVTFAAAKIYLITNGGDIQTFALLLTAEMAVSAAIFALHSINSFAIFNAHRIWALAKTLLILALPMLIRSAMIAVYLRADQISVSWIMDTKSLGLYASAARLTEIWFFFPAAIMMVYAPELATKWQTDRLSFDKVFRLLLATLVAAASIFALVMIIFSKQIIVTIFGSSFSLAAMVLPFLGVSVVFGTVGQVSSLWLVNAGETLTAMKQSLLCACTSIPLYVIMTWQFGIVGTAVAFAFLQMFSSILVNAIFPGSRPLLYLQINALSFGLLKMKSSNCHGVAV